MLVHVGSSNPVKLAAVRKAMAVFRKGARVRPTPVETGVSAQPISLGETVKGARLRAERCRGDADLGIGIESGLFRVAGATFGVTIAAATDGTSTALGGGPFLQVPREAVDWVLKGEDELGEALSRIYGIPNPGKGAGAVGVLTHGRVTRQRATEMAVVMALAGLQGVRKP